MAVARLCCAMLAAAAFCSAACGDALPDGWAPKFYHGLEAAGRISSDQTGFRGREPAIYITWESGMPKFGVAKRVETELRGVVDWAVSAYVKCGDNGRAAAAMEFFDEQGRSLGVQDGVSRFFGEWTRVTWKFTSPRKATLAEVHLLSLAEAAVSFARVEVSSCQGIDKGELPFGMKILPAEWNRDWNGGKTRMSSFSDAPLPMTVLLRGERRELKSPSLEVDLPDELEIKDAFCPVASEYGRETPASATQIATNGSVVTRVRFENLRYFACMTPKFDTDKGGGIVLVIGPKAGGEGMEKVFPVVCRIADGDRLAAERTVEMAFRPLPRGLRKAKRFIAMGWNCADRLFSDDKALCAALCAYEAAGLRMYRLGGRTSEIRELLESRPVPYVFATRFGDLWMPSRACISKKELSDMGGRLSVTSDGEGRRAGKICPQFFTSSAAFHRHLEEKVIRPALEKSGVKDGDWVTLDMEPWQSNTYCYCDECLKAFAAFAKLDHAPTMQEVRESPKMKTEWAEFRVRHSARTVEIIEGAVHRYNPSLKIMDYDYILEYGNPTNRLSFIQGCAKDTRLNERWLDGHLCSYYHRIGRLAFEAMKNNVRNLSKPYYPMAGLSGYASWVRPGEVLNPGQIRQFALAAFVNGCSGYAFYSGNCFDGEVLLAMMQAQDTVARYEDLPWGRVDGRTVVEGPADRTAYASTVRPDGTEVVAVFNYDEAESIEVKVGGRTHSVAPLGVEFVEECLDSPLPVQHQAFEEGK